MIKAKSIYKLIIYSIIFIILLTSFFTFIIISSAYTEFQEKVNIIEQNNLNKQKALLEDDISLVIKFIEYYHQENKNLKTEEQIKNGIISMLDHLKTNNDINEYIFIYDFEGKSVYYQKNKEYIGKNLYEFQDPNGVQVIKSLIDASMKENGDFVQYYWYKPEKGKEAEKISFAQSYKPWGWTIGKGVYLDSIEKVVQEAKLTYDDKINDYIIQIITLTILLVLYSIFIYKNATILISDEINEIGKYFKESQTSDEANHSKIVFTEFKTIVNYANDAMKNIKYRTHLLEEINKNLEKKVDEKTKELSTILKVQKEFLKKAVHEINTPLSIIQTNIDLLRMQNYQNIHLKNIESGSKIINTIYEDLSYMIQKNHIEYKKTYLDFSAYLKNRIEFFNDIAISNKLLFITNIEDNITINFNETELQRVIDNNISNALKYTFKDSVIFIKLLKQNNIALFEIKSNSNKIADTNKIFNDQFYRENCVKGGFGLGLKIVKEICNQNEVTINVNSTSKETIFQYGFKV